MSEERRSPYSAAVHALGIVEDSGAPSTADRIAIAQVHALLAIADAIHSGQRPPQVRYSEGAAYREPPASSGVPGAAFRS